MRVAGRLDRRAPRSPSSCLGVLERWSSPRITSRDPHVGVVDGDREVVEHRCRRRGRSRSRPEAAFANRTSPRIRSSTTVSPSSGTRRRTAAPSASSAALAPVAGVAVLLLPGADVVGGGRCPGRPLPASTSSLERARVALGPLGLAQRALVPVELEPAQRVEDLLDVLRGRALAVGVLDPQHQLPAASPRVEPVVECRPRSTDVEGARR